MKLKQIISCLVPRIEYTGVSHSIDIEVESTNGVKMVLKRSKTLGEEILFKCYERQTNIYRGFVVKNMKYGFFGDVCERASDAIASADDAWFRFMGIARRQKQK